MNIKENEITYCNGVMGFPITFLDKYNPNQFEIVAFRKDEDEKDLIFIQWKNYLCQNNNKKTIEPIDYFFPLSLKTRAGGTMNGLINGKETYRKILIKRK